MKINNNDKIIYIFIKYIKMILLLYSNHDLNKRKKIKLYNILKLIDVNKINIYVICVDNPNIQHWIKNNEYNVVVDELPCFLTRINDKTELYSIYEWKYINTLIKIGKN